MRENGHDHKLTGIEEKKPGGDPEKRKRKELHLFWCLQQLVEIGTGKKNNQQRADDVRVGMKMIEPLQEKTVAQHGDGEKKRCGKRNPFYHNLSQRLLEQIKVETEFYSGEDIKDPVIAAVNLEVTKKASPFHYKRKSQ